MLRIMSEERQHTMVISLSRNDVFYARHAIPTDAERYAHVAKLANGETRLIMRKDCIVVVEDLRNPHMRADLVLFIREDRSREGVYSLWFAEPENVADLREALTFLNIPQVHVVTGMTDAVIYSDEILVLDYDKRAPYGWIIKREDVSRYIEVLPKGRDSGQMDLLYIWREIHEQVDGKRRPMIRIEGWSKYPNLARDNATLKSFDEYVVVYDTGSRVIKEITITNTNKSVDAVSCDKGPLRGIQVGKRLPTNLGRTKW